MELSRKGRIAAVLLLLFSLFGLLVLGGMDRPPAPELGDYPNTADIVQNSEQYQSQLVSTGGRVVSTEPVEVRAEYHTATGVETVRLTITDVGRPVSTGDNLRVFGVLTGPRTVQATNVVVVPQTGMWYAWGSSFIAGLWVLSRIAKHWEIRVELAALSPRSEPLQLFRERW